ncbi:hypothetical protein UlMin_005534 [Ulmus minor]
MENQIVDGVEAANFSALNCIDLSNPDIQQSVSLLKQACLDCGFFYVVNHGISQEFMEEVFAQSKRMFSLPLSEKMKLLRNEKNRGYIPVFYELFDPVNQVQRDTKEGYDIGVEVAEDDPDAEKPYYGPNIWPQQDQLPRWRETMEKFHQQALEVARSVARIIALALGLDRDFFDKPEMLGEPFATLRLLHYEGQTDPSKGIFGAGAHSDFGLITLLATDDILGLQICNDKDAKPQKWEYVAPMKGSFIFTSFLWLIFYGAFIVNLGDLLERWSNCIFKSTLHEVLANDQDRYSIRLLLICIFCLMQGLQIAYFVYPSHDCLVECLPTFAKSYLNFNELFATFPSILCQTYLDQRNKDI